MDEIFAGLIGILEKQTNLYRELLKISHEKQQELIGGTLAVLENLTKREELLIYQIGRLEEERIRCAGLIAERHNLVESASMQELSLKAAVGERERLEELSGILDGIIHELSRHNTENMDLIRHSLKYINFSINVLTRPEGQSGIYNAEREVKAGNVVRLIDRKV